MTRVLRLESKGFKSFANKTEIEFGEKFNCILGPNGSGKSNVLDSICFVLGKSSAKGLRAEKSANLIYNGGKSKQPAKEGMVSITFDNDDKIFGDFKELTITRIVKKNGSSVYKINDETRTRQEVLDMMSKARIDPDGYNIILQGDIVRLVEMSSNERRGIIEEIAGIGIYEEKKIKAVRELDRVEAKLNEAHIVLTERDTYLKELKKERDQAAKFKELDEKIKRNKKTIVTTKLTKKNKELETFQERVSKNQQESEKLEEEEKKLSLEKEELKGEIEEINREVEAKGEKEQVQIHKQVEQLKVDFAVKKQRIEDLDKEIKKVKERKEDLKKTNKELFDKIKLIENDKKESQKEIESRRKNIDQLQKSLDDFKKKHKMEDAAGLDTKIAEIDKEAEEIQEELAKLRGEQQTLFREKDRIEIRLEQADDQIEKVLELEKANKEQVTELKQKKEEFKKATKELSTALNDDTSIGSQLSTARQKLLSKKEELGKLEAQHNTIKEGVAGGLAVQKILEKKKEIQGICGTVAELGSVNEEYALALETAAGGRMMSVVVENDNVAKECIQYLRNSRQGVATFLPLNKIRSPQQVEAPKKKGVIGRATDLISYDKKFSKVFEYVFGTTIIVDTIDTARSIGVGTIRMVTLQGDTVETSGAMSGGYRNRKRNIGFQQKEVTEKIDNLEKMIADLESVVRNLEQRRQDNEEAITRLRNVKGDLEGDIIKLEKTLHLDSKDLDMNKDLKKQLESELKSMDSRVDEITEKVSEKNRSLAMLKSEKQKLRDQMSEMRSPAVLAQLTSFEEKQTELKQEITNYQAKLQANESEIKNILGPESEKITGILKQQDKEIDDFEREASELKGEVKEIQSELKEKEAAEKKFFEQFKELFNRRNKLSEEISKKEEKIREKASKRQETQQKNNNISLEVARLKAEISGLEEEDKQYHVEPYKNKPEEEIFKEIKEFEKMREDFGSVNMKALDIYENVLEEYNELVKKREKLNQEREDVHLMINEVDDKKKELFMKTYEVVGENFKTIFEMLSTKGKAHLELEDTKDPFNGGLTIKVKLSSKKFMDIRSLSGGEKTMTALAFLFAVQEYEPASFYILDEVDAALDKHNSEKLAKLVRAYCKNAQYIIISHNDGVISEEDNLYGVSMNEHGMSKVTSLKV